MFVVCLESVRHNFAFAGFLSPLTVSAFGCSKGLRHTALCPHICIAINKNPPLSRLLVRTRTIPAAQHSADTHTNAQCVAAATQQRWGLLGL